jgi:chromate reductase, NAD(P)H dehydrogenase (quinone)
MTISLLAFSGSARVGSLNQQLVSCAAQHAQSKGVATTMLNLGDLDIPMYHADLEAKGMPRDVLRLKELMLSHEAWLIASPEFNGSTTGLLKNAIDWASCPIKSDPKWVSGNKPFKGKVVGLMAAAPGALGGVRGLSGLTLMLMNLHAWVAPTQYALAHANHAFDEAGVLVHDTQRKAVAAVVDQVVLAARQFRAHPST